MKKADVVIIVILLVLAIGGYGVSRLLLNHKYTNKYVVISVGGKLYQKVLVKDNKFTKTIKIKTALGTNVVDILKGGAEMQDASCHDKICIKEGFKDKPGDTIICLPNKLVVEIKGEDKAETDEVSY
jgi:hypothetical protein